MSALAIDSKRLIEDCFAALSHGPKTEDLIDRFVANASLKQHILEAEVGFPEYQLLPHDMVAEGDRVAVRTTMLGTHKGTFFGVPATGRQVEVGAMLFYRVDGERIVEWWMQMDAAGLMSQLTA